MELEQLRIFCAVAACRSFTPCRRASATASLHVPYRFTSSALAGPSLFTV